MMPRSISFTIQNGVGLEAYSVRLAGSRHAMIMGRRCWPNTRNAATNSSTTAAIHSSLGAAGGVGGGEVPGQNHDHLRDDENGQKKWKERLTFPGRRKYSWPMITCAYVYRAYTPIPTANNGANRMPPEGEYGSSDSDRHNNE
jgi:hypothetical protein